MAKVSTLVDNFNDDEQNTALWGYTSMVREVNGRIEIRPSSNLAGGFGCTSVTTWDLTDSEMRIELVKPLHTGGPESGMAAAAAGEAVQISVRDGELECLQLVASVWTVLEHVPYDRVQHRWLRLRERAGITYWEASPDAVTWQTIHSRANPIPVTAVQVQFGVRLPAGLPAPGVAVFDSFNAPDTGRERRVEARRLAAREVREQAAELAAERAHDAHFNNNDEVSYLDTPLAGNFSKSLDHDDLGDPDPVSYASLVRALQSRDPQDFEEIILGPAGDPVKLVNPQAGLTFDLESLDPQARTMPPAPRFDSQVAAHEMGELYWMAVLRDVPFTEYGTNADVAAAVESMNSEFPQFGGTVPVTTDNLFRGVFPGEQMGPYVSQFLLKGNVDPRKPAGQGRDAADGFISYGSRTIDQRLFPATPGVNYLDEFASWLDVQNGFDTRGQDTFDSTKRFIRDLRGAATFVHFDTVVDAFYNAAFLLMSEPTGDQSTAAAATGRPQLDREFGTDPGDPYLNSPTQSGFATFGPIHLLQVLSEVLGRALRAVWWQKWGVHRRLRPEEYGGRVHNQITFNQTSGTEGRAYPLESSIITSLQSGDLAPYFSTGPFANSFLLPQAYAEGAPTHPAYGAGHATGAGACATILKAFFDEDTVIQNPLESSADGLSLVAYGGTDVLTVGGELNKLAGNIALFRNGAGVHWRTDYTESLPLGEAVAIALLQEMTLGFNEDDAFFQITKFDGQTIRIFDGKVQPVIV